MYSDHQPRRPRSLGHLNQIAPRVIAPGSLGFDRDAQTARTLHDRQQNRSLWSDPLLNLTQP